MKNSNELIIAGLGSFSILLLLLGLGANRRVAVPSATTVRPALTLTPSPLPLADEIAAIKRVVFEADFADSRAMRSRSTEGLAQLYSGEALEQERQKVELLVKARQWADQALIHLEFNDIDYKKGSSVASVVVTEYWDTKLFACDTNQCVSQNPRHQSPQKQTLVRQLDGHWKVHKIEHFSDDEQPEDKDQGLTEDSGEVTGS